MDRLDLWLLNNNLVKSREKAQEFIKEGCVTINGYIQTKPSYRVKENDTVNMTPLYNYVGRGALKLEYLVKNNIVSFKGLSTLDIGASTGGFTEIMLLDGARHVVSLDVGSNQLDSSLRNRSDVTVMENTDIRDAEFDEKFDAITIDVSFISITKVFPKAFCLLNKDGFICALFKPEYETGEPIKNKGLYNNPKLHREILFGINRFINENDFCINYISASPIRGGNGNIEYIAVVSMKKSKNPDIDKVVREAFIK